MNHDRTLAAAFLLGLGLFAAPTQAEAQRALILAQPSEPNIESPRLAALWQQLKAGNVAALDAFWREIQGKAPLIEPNPANPTKVRVTFIQRGGDTVESILLNGGLPRPDSSWPLTRLPNTNLWYHTERLPADARFELPGAPTGPWTRRLPNAPQGKIARRALKSQSLKETRGFTVYTPSGYDPAGGPYGLLVLFDGEWYRDPQLINGPVILDNLIAQHQIAPLVVVMVENSTGNADRNRDLSNSPAFADFLAGELVPWVRQNYAVSSDPTRSIVGGLSLGGSMASYCGLRHPDVFGNVLSQDGAYWVWEGYPQVGTLDLATETGWLTRQFATSPKLPLRFSLEVGRLEKWFSFDYPLENRRLRDVLQAKGYPVAYEEINGSHDPLNWRSTLADGLIALAGPPPSP